MYGIYRAGELVAVNSDRRELLAMTPRYGSYSIRRASKEEVASFLATVNTPTENTAPGNG